MENRPVQSLDRDRRAITRVLRAALIVSVAISVVLLVLLATASGNTRLFERHYPVLLWITIAVGGVIVALVFELFRRLVARYRRRLFGTRLMARMAGAFILMTVVPVVLVFVVAVQFVGRSIESWFDVPLERALDSGMSLARASLDAQLADLSQKASLMASELGDAGPAMLPAALSRIRGQLRVPDALVVTGGGRVVAASSSRLTQLLPELPPSEALRQARLTRHYARVEGIGTGSGSNTLQMRVITAIDAPGQLLEETRFLQLVQAVPTALEDNADAVQQGYRDFQELSLARAGLKRIFRTTLTLTFLLTLFAAVAGAFLLAGWLVGPLAELAAATRSVAEGDFRQVKDYTGRDELGVLTRSFNEMTRQLQDARALVDRNQRELESAHAQLQSVLINLDAGVMVLDAQWRLMLANPGADRILGAELAVHLGDELAQLPRVGALADEIRAAFVEQAAAGSGSWQRQYVLTRASRADEPAAGSVPAQTEQTLLARGSTLSETRAGYVIVFDDISAVISAQRAVAWAEVARRLAHEITNPLTPIQLAAERTHLKLRDKLTGPDAELLEKNSRTIVNQVAALKAMVDEFRNYARLPAARLVPLNLNELVEDVLRLYSASANNAAIRLELGHPLEPVLGDATQLRQVVHNLLKNALEAAEKTERPEIIVSTASLKMADGHQVVRLRVRDNGSGFAPAMLARAFEPYVTSKARGTGLGLAIVRKIVDEHGARIDLVNRLDDAGQVLGAQVSILFTKLAKSVDNRPLESVVKDRDRSDG
ncbi:MAG: ATP-binding protein [Quisquiliibacterium sp.]|jgi:nitrogen fixation/metabolism regulation signal transduction histidine kinase